MLLVVAADLLVADLAGVRDQWVPGAANFREQFLADPRGAVQSALQGMAVLSAGEMANRRLRAPLEADGPEMEHSRFSDTTIDDLVGNARGVRMAYLGEYDGVTGVSISEVVARFDPERDADLRKQLDNNLEATRALPDPFDQVVLAGEDDPDRAEVADLADDLQVQGEAVVALAAVLGLSITAGT
jgi:putative iron-regulated protein